jgi:hypothetical protein
MLVAIYICSGCEMGRGSKVRRVATHPPRPRRWRAAAWPAHAAVPSDTESYSQPISQLAGWSDIEFGDRKVEACSVL